MSAFSLANSALEYIPPVDVNGITIKSASAKTKGVCCTCCRGIRLHIHRAMHSTTAGTCSYTG